MENGNYMYASNKGTHFGSFLLTTLPHTDCRCIPQWIGHTTQVLYSDTSGRTPPRTFPVGKLQGWEMHAYKLVTGQYYSIQLDIPGHYFHSHDFHGLM